MGGVGIGAAARHSLAQSEALGEALEASQAALELLLSAGVAGAAEAGARLRGLEEAAAAREAEVEEGGWSGARSCAAGHRAQ